MVAVQDKSRFATFAYLALFCLLAILGGAIVHSQSTPGQDRETVVELRIAGAERFPIDKIVRHIRTRANRPYDPDLVEEDVRRLNTSRMFLDVKVSTQQVPEGRIVIFQVVERPVLKYVQYVGCEKVGKKTLAKEVNLKVGGPVDPYAVTEGRRKIEEYYQSKGFGKVQVTIFEGDKPDDEGAVYLIHEGPKQRVLWTQFEGNTFASDARLRTHIKSKPAFLWLFGTLDRKQIDEDVNRLTAYYRSMGFFQAKVGRELSFTEGKGWLVLTYVIDEGPRYQVRNITVLGSEKLSSEELSRERKLTPGKFFNQNEMIADKTRMQDLYGSHGYAFAQVKEDLRFDEEPGVLDVIYNVHEGEQYRVGRIDVRITGENPHTRITTVLNRMSLWPGQLYDVRELRASERRLKSSYLFENDPIKGTTPHIAVVNPSGEADGEGSGIPEKSGVAERPRRRGGYRLQSPDAPQDGGQSAWQPLGSGASPAPSPAEPAPNSAAAPGAGQPSEAKPLRWAAPRQPEVYRGQGGTYDSNDGFAVPSLGPSLPSPRPPSAWSAEAPALPAASGPALAPTPALGPGAGTTSGYRALQPPGVGGAYVAPSAPDPAYASPLPPEFVGPALGDAFAEPQRYLPLRPELVETMTGKFMFSVGVNSDAGVLGSIIVDEQNFDWTRFPHSWEDIANGTAWRGAGQKFRIEAMPGSQLQRYAVSFTEPYLLDTKISESLSAFYYDRVFREWTERRAGGRVSFGYQFLPDLWGTFAYRFEDVHISNPVVPRGFIPELDEVLGSNTLHGLRVQLTRDTRDNQFLATEGSVVELGFEQVLGSFTYPRADFDVRKYFLLHQHPDGSGRHVLSLSSRFAWTGSDTPIYEHFYAGGFSTIRGFEFRGVTPRMYGVGVGGHFSLLNSTEYLFPITADDMLRAVVFCDTGTIQPTIDHWDQRYRAAVGFGLRITIPAMGPAPIALDFAFPLLQQPGDQTQVFSFFVGWMR
jgi:outer membrane protein insertion porin family